MGHALEQVRNLMGIRLKFTAYTGQFQRQQTLDLFQVGKLEAQGFIESAPDRLVQQGLVVGGGNQQAFPSIASSICRTAFTERLSSP